MIYSKLIKASLSTMFDEIQLIATPDRQPVKSIEEFTSKAAVMHKTRPIFANVHETTWDYKPIRTNKIFFDFDIPKGFIGAPAEGRQLVEQDIQTVKQRLIDRGISKKDILRIWTTMKGDHLYTKMKNISYEDEKSWLELKRRIKGFQQKMTEGCITADRKVFADFSRIARTPGVERYDTGLVPIPISIDLPLQEWLIEHNGWGSLVEAGEEILWNWGNGVKAFSDFVKDDDYKHLVVYKNSIRTEIIDSGVKRIDAYGGQKYHEHLNEVFENCMPRSFIGKLFEVDADYNTRIAGATYLLESGFDGTLITNLLSMIGWGNFDYDTTFDHVRTLRRWNDEKNGRQNP